MLLSLFFSLQAVTMMIGMQSCQRKHLAIRKILFTNREDFFYITYNLMDKIFFQNQEGCQICVPELVHFP